MPDSAPDNADTEPRTTARLLTIPNLLCLIRLGGSPVLAMLAWQQQPQPFFWLYLGLAMTDWVDGKLAIMLNQRSVYGARLDSWADAAMYTALLYGALQLHWDILAPELAWILPAIGSYAGSTLFGFFKFGRWPGYHTRMAKLSWLLTTIAAIATLSRWSLWPLRVATVSVTLTNLEAILLTRTLQEWKADVSSLAAIRKTRQQQPSSDNRQEDTTN